MVKKPLSGCFRRGSQNMLATSFCKFLTDLLQVDCQNLLSADLLQVVSTCGNKPDFSKPVVT